MGEAVENKRTQKKMKNDFIECMLFYMRLSSLKHLSYIIDVPFVMYCVAVTSIGAVSGWVMFYYKYNDLSVNTDHLLYAVIWGHLLYDYITYLRNRALLVNMTEDMYSRFCQFNNQLALQKYQHVWNKADKTSLFVMRFMNFAVTSLYVFHIYNAKIFSSNRKLIFPLWVPYSLESDFNYFLTITFQLTMLYLNSVVHLSGLALCIGGSHFIGASLDVLGLAYEEICEKGIRKKDIYKEGNIGYNFKTQPVTEKMFTVEKLKWCVETHVHILRFVKAYKSIFETILIEVLLSCEVVICFAGFQAVLAAEKRDYGKMAQDCLMILIITFHLFTYCYPGQHIYNKSEQFRASLYHGHWEDQSVSFQKSMKIMLTATVHPISITFRGIANASMPSFQHAMRTAFSYINILMVLKDVNQY